MLRLNLIVLCLLSIQHLSPLNQLTAEPAPPAGWSVPVKIIDVYDGDTVVVEVKKHFRVRLLDCWAPEIKTKDAAEKVRGIAARDHLAQILPEGTQGTLYVPGNTDIGKSITFGRFLGHIWAKDGTANVSQQQVEAGFATPEKVKK